MTCLIEQVDRNNGELGNLRCALPRLDLIEDQIQKWRCRLPDVMVGDEINEVIAPIEAQEELQASKEADRRRIEEIRDVIPVIQFEERVNILRRFRSETWDLLSERLTSELDRASTTLNDRVAEVERAVHTRSASPATTQWNRIQLPMKTLCN